MGFSIVSTISKIIIKLPKDNYFAVCFTCSYQSVNPDKSNEKHIFFALNKLGKIMNMKTNNMP
jgi:hypothetical protein